MALSPLGLQRLQDTVKVPCGVVAGAEGHISVNRTTWEVLELDPVTQGSCAMLRGQDPGCAPGTAWSDGQAGQGAEAGLDGR